jgi:hypothetical protein
VDLCDGAVSNHCYRAHAYVDSVTLAALEEMVSPFRTVSGRLALVPLFMAEEGFECTE